MITHNLREAFDRKRNELLRENHQLNEIGLSNDNTISAVNAMQDILIPGVG